MLYMHSPSFVNTIWILKSGYRFGHGDVSKPFASPKVLIAPTYLGHPICEGIPLSHFSAQLSKRLVADEFRFINFRIFKRQKVLKVVRGGAESKKDYSNLPSFPAKI